MKKFKGILTILLSATIGFGLTFGIGYFLGADVVSNDSGQETNLIYMLLTVGVSAYVSIYLQTFIHELGHLVFGLLTGYKFSMFRVGSLTLKRNYQSNKLEFKKQTIAGTGGQCLMVPPKQVDGKYPVVLYNMGGPIFSLLGALPLLALPYISNYYLGLFTTIFGAIGLMYALTNGIPFKSKFITNDGYNALSLYKNSQARMALYNQLLINHEYMKGLRLFEMPSEWFEVPSNVDKNNSMATSTYIFKENRLFEECKFDEVRSLIQELKSGDYNLVGVYDAMLSIDLTIIDLIQKGKDADLSNLEDDSVKSVRKAMKSQLLVQILDYALAVIIDEDRQKADKVKENIEKNAETSVYPAEIKQGRELMDIINKSIELQEEPSI